MVILKLYKYFKGVLTMFKYKTQHKLYNFSHILEIVVGFLAIIPIMLSIVSLAVSIPTGIYFESGALLLFLQHTIEIIIGIEFIKLIFVHTLDSTIEVIIMAIVRQLIIEHASSFDTLALVFAICLLFVVRKFLFVEKLDRIKTNTIIDDKCEKATIEEITHVDEQVIAEN